MTTTEPSWTERLSNWVSYNFQTKIENRFASTTDSLAAGVEKATKGNLDISKNTAKTIIPMVGGVAIAGAGFLLLKPIQWGTQKLFGLLGKIPFIGGLFKKAGEYVSYAIPVAAGFLGYKMLQNPANGFLPNGSQTGAHHTGQIGAPPIMTGVRIIDPKTGQELASEEAPLRPADPPAPLSDKNQKIVDEALAPTGLSADAMSKVIALRTKAQQEDKKELDEALKQYIAHHNKIYENTRLWVAAANTFRDGPRKRLIAALEKIGMTSLEANDFVPLPPRLPATIYSDGKDFPPELITFIKDFENAYGKGGPKDAKTESNELIFTFAPDGQTPRRMTWDEMGTHESAVSLKEEYLRKAVKFVENRYTYFQSKKKTFRTSAGEPGTGSSWEGYDSVDHSKKSWYHKVPIIQDFTTPPDLPPQYGLSFSDEAKHVDALCGIKSKGGFYHYFHTEPKKFAEILEKWREQQNKSDTHRKTLRDACPQIKTFEAAVVVMKERLTLMEKFRGSGIAIVGIKKQENSNNIVITLEDYRTPGAENRYSFLGTISGTTFNAIKGAPSLLTEDIKIDDINDPKKWGVLIDKVKKSPLERYRAGALTTIKTPTTAELEAGFDEGTIKIEISDNKLGYDGKIIVYCSETVTQGLVVSGYQLRGKHLKDNDPGRFVTDMYALQTQPNRIINLGSRAGFKELFDDIAKEVDKEKLKAQGKPIYHHQKRNIKTTLHWGTQYHSADMYLITYEIPGRPPITFAAQSLPKNQVQLNAPRALYVTHWIEGSRSFPEEIGKWNALHCPVELDQVGSDLFKKAQGNNTTAIKLLDTLTERATLKAELKKKGIEILHLETKSGKGDKPYEKQYYFLSYKTTSKETVTLVAQFENDGHMYITHRFNGPMRDVKWDKLKTSIKLDNDGQDLFIRAGGNLETTSKLLLKWIDEPLLTASLSSPHADILTETEDGVLLPSQSTPARLLQELKDMPIKTPIA